MIPRLVFGGDFLQTLKNFNKMAYERYKLELPERLSMTSIEMKCWAIIGNLHHDKAIQEQVMELVGMIKEKQSEVTKWKEVMFAIANRID
jgi:hypothetical protein